MTTSGPSPTGPTGSRDDRSPRPPTRGPRRGRVVAVFAALLIAFAAGLWGSIVRPPAYEVRGEVVARAAPDLLVIRHEAVAVLGMSAMETMTVVAEPRLLDDVRLAAGDRVRMAVRQRGDEVVVVWLEKER